MTEPTWLTYMKGERRGPQGPVRRVPAPAYGTLQHEGRGTHRRAVALLNDCHGLRTTEEMADALGWGWHHTRDVLEHLANVGKVERFTTGLGKVLWGRVIPHEPGGPR